MLYVFIGIVVIIILYVLITLNSLIKLNNDVKESFATMDVVLKKRWDLIPNLVEVVKAYAAHEKNTLTGVIALRNSSYDDLSDKEKLETNEKINKEINKIMALVEKYPELKANTNFLNLSQNLSDVEDELAKSRRYYNAIVRMYNNKVEMIPSNLVAKIFGYKIKDMFSVEDEERENVEVKL